MVSDCGRRQRTPDYFVHTHVDDDGRGPKIEEPLTSAGVYGVHRYARASQDPMPIARLPLRRGRRLLRRTVTRWERIRRQNHWFDCLYLASAAAHLCGIRLIDEPPRVVDDRPRVTGGIRREDGRPWIDLSRWHPVWERERD